jgi:hypothetical protein
MDSTSENRQTRYQDSNSDPGFSFLRMSLILGDRPDEGQATDSGFKR